MVPHGRPTGSHVALIGPHVDAKLALVGNYLGQLCPSGPTDVSCVESPLEAITRVNEHGKVVSSPGCMYLSDSPQLSTRSVV